MARLIVGSHNMRALIANQVHRFCCSYCSWFFFPGMRLAAGVAFCAFNARKQWVVLFTQLDAKNSSFRQLLRLQDYLKAQVNAFPAIFTMTTPSIRTYILNVFTMAQLSSLNVIDIITTNLYKRGEIKKKYFITFLELYRIISANQRSHKISEN